MSSTATGDAVHIIDATPVLHIGMGLSQPPRLPIKTTPRIVVLVNFSK